MKKKIDFKQSMNELVFSVVAIALSLGLAALIMLLAGYNPAAAYSAMLDGAFGSANAIANTLAKSFPDPFFSPHSVNAGGQFYFAVYLRFSEQYPMECDGIRQAQSDVFLGGDDI